MARPKARGLGGLRANVVRGPHRDDARSPASRRRWYWRILDNRSGRRTLWSGWATEAEVERELAALVAGGPGALDVEPALDTVAQLLGAWLAHLEDERPDLAQRSVVAYRGSCRRLRGVLGSVLLERLTQAELERARARALAAYAPQTVALDLVALRAAWAWGRGRGACPDRELPRLEVPVPSVTRYTPTDAEIARVLDALTVPWHRVALQLLWATGARIGEIATLTWDRIDWTRGEIEVIGKTGPRVVPLDPDILDLLRAWRLEVPPDEPGVLGRAPNTARAHLGRALAAAQQATGGRRWTPHAIRRAVVDRLCRSGVPVEVAADVLGHSVEVMIAHYRQVSDADRRDAVRRARLGRLPRGQVIALPGPGDDR